MLLLLIGEMELCFHITIMLRPTRELLEGSLKKKNLFFFYFIVYIFNLLIFLFVKRKIRIVCQLIKRIQKIFYESNPNNLKIHCIGHSLGAHTCGYASTECGSTFDRISGKMQNIFFSKMNVLFF